MTGGCGFLGSALVSRLITQGDDVIVFDDLSRVGSEANRQWLSGLGSHHYHHGDIRSQTDVDSVIRRWKPDVVFHLAGQVAMTTSMENPRRDFEVNVLGTLHVLEAMREHVPDHTALVYASSNKVYGHINGAQLEERETRWDAPDFPSGFDERLPLDLRTPYGVSKGCAEQYVLEYARSFAIRGIVFRHSTIFGDRQVSTFDQGWIGWFASEAIRIYRQQAGMVSISGDGKQVRDILYVDDAVDAYLSAVAHAGDVSGQPFNIGGGSENSVSIRELLAFFESALEVKIPFEVGPWRHEDQRFFVSDTGRAATALDWRPRTTLAEGLSRVLRRLLTY